MKEIKSVRGVYYDLDYSPYKLTCEGLTLVFSSQARLMSFKRKYAIKIKGFETQVAKLKQLGGHVDGLLEKSKQTVAQNVYDEVEPYVKK